MTLKPYLKMADEYPKPFTAKLYLDSGDRFRQLMSDSKLMVLFLDGEKVTGIAAESIDDIPESYRLGFPKAKIGTFKDIEFKVVQNG